MTLPAPKTVLANASLEEARAAMLACARPLVEETVPLAEAAGRTLAAPLAARRPLPPYPASAMDGWAVRRADLGKGPLTIIGESAAGARFPGRLGPGEAVRIFTGAPVPDGADRVVIQEEATREAGQVRLAADPAGKSNIRPAGIDLAAGAIALSPGRRLDPAAIGLAAACGCALLPVRAQPRVALLATGSELAPPGADPGPDQIFETNSFALSALINAWGGRARTLAPEADDRDAIADAVEAVLKEAELVVLIGGASVGDHDLAKPALQRLGLALVVDTVKVRPGKPVFMGLIGSVPVLGLPGNPASAFVCAHLFLKPLLAALQGAPPDPLTPLAARLAAPLKAEGPRETFLRARIACDRDGVLHADPAPDQDSSLTRVLAAANGLIRRPAFAPAADIGEPAPALLFEGRAPDVVE